MKTAPKIRISRITIGRLYNLGNYEHVRYEIEVEIPPEKNPSDATLQLMRILAALNPKAPCTRGEFVHACKMIAVDPGTLVGFEKDNLDTYRRRIAEFEKWSQRRAVALKLLDKLGGADDFRDAKLDWDDFEY